MPAPFVLAFTLPGLPKLPNELGQRAHWRTVRRHTRAWKEAVAIGVGRCRPHEPLPYARVELVRASSREPDPDALAQSFKPIIDGLVTAGVLEDDSPAHCALEVRWTRAPPRKGWIGVSVREVRPDAARGGMA